MLEQTTTGVYVGANDGGVFYVGIAVAVGGATWANIEQSLNLCWRNNTH
jgi:hypothetical protein